WQLARDRFNLRLTLCGGGVACWTSPADERAHAGPARGELPRPDPRSRLNPAGCAVAATRADLPRGKSADSKRQDCQPDQSKGEERLCGTDVLACRELPRGNSPARRVRGSRLTRRAISQGLQPATPTTGQCCFWRGNHAPFTIDSRLP